MQQGSTVMRQFIIAIAIATGLVALWAAIVPLTAQPALKPAGAASPALSKALFLCRGPNGIDRACTTALAHALTIEQPTGSAAKSEVRACRPDATAQASLRD
jgi:hypothetical protein